ncbi:MAG: cation:proton antiporter [Halofilum sp. (in: g-proteobacteria)]|nr:cation:proton antiporter [Halofilum sp. (in: g-proteobacteria)]
MVFASQLILGIGVLLLVSVLASRISDRIGAPLLLLFLLLGMLLGEDGPGGIVFNDVDTAFLVASLALAVILFDGGLHTPRSSFRLGLRPALVLATVGVVITAGITGAAAVVLFDIGVAEGLLIGAIVGSTDAAAVFYLLHAHGLRINDRLQATLEIESGSNDPMAVFLTVSARSRWCVPAASARPMPSGSSRRSCGRSAPAAPSVRSRESCLPAWSTGLASRNRSIRSSCWPPAWPSSASRARSAAAASWRPTSAGVVAGNAMRRARHEVRRFHDGMAWLCQVGLFLMLGLLVTPSELVPLAPLALALAGVLILVARPVAVILSLVPFRFAIAEQLFISWVGLRGAVPIVLGLYPLLAGTAEGRTAFNVAFFVVLVSLLLQGWTVAPAARRLGLQLPARAAGPDAWSSSTRPAWRGASSWSIGSLPGARRHRHARCAICPCPRARG